MAIRSSNETPSRTILFWDCKCKMLQVAINNYSVELVDTSF